VNSPAYEDHSGCGCIDPLKARMWNNDFLFLERAGLLNFDAIRD